MLSLVMLVGGELKSKDGKRQVLHRSVKFWEGSEMMNGFVVIIYPLGHFNDTSGLCWYSESGCFWIRGQRILKPTKEVWGSWELCGDTVKLIKGPTGLCMLLKTLGYSPRPRPVQWEWGWVYYLASVPNVWVGSNVKCRIKMRRYFGINTTDMEICTRRCCDWERSAWQ